MDTPLRIGIIGYGFMVKPHSNAWRQVPHFFPLKAKVEMHTICGRDRAKVESARGQLGWQYAATDWQEVVESPLIEVVDICTSNSSHAEIAMAAARAGKHVLCEKPLAMTVAEAAKMLATAPTGRGCGRIGCYCRQGHGESNRGRCDRVSGEIRGQQRRGRGRLRHLRSHAPGAGTQELQSLGNKWRRGLAKLLLRAHERTGV